MLVGWRQGWRQNRCCNHSLQCRCWERPAPSLRFKSSRSFQWDSGCSPSCTVISISSKPKDLISKGCRSSVHNEYKQWCNTIRIILFVRCIDHADQVRSYVYVVYIVYPVQNFGWEDFASFDVMLWPEWFPNPCESGTWQIQGLLKHKIWRRKCLNLPLPCLSNWQ